MDDASVGQHCAVCQRKDFFAFHCPTCKLFYCGDHRHVSCDTGEDPLKRTGHASTDFIQCSYYKDGVVCQKEGVSRCALCPQIFCLVHRFEDQHPCQGLLAQEEAK
jgi:hypothetical protein